MTCCARLFRAQLLYVRPLSERPLCAFGHLVCGRYVALPVLALLNQSAVTAVFAVTAVLSVTAAGC